MDIGNALRRSGRDDITIRAIIANTIHELYPQDYIIESVKIHGKIIRVTTGKALINSELKLGEADIKKTSLKKLKNMGIILSEEIRFQFI